MLNLFFGVKLQETVRIVRTERLADGSVVVELAVKRRMIVAGELFEWEDREPFVHNAAEVRRFRELIDRLKARGKKPTIKDAVLAYLIVFNFARKSVIAGFLWALRDLYPEFIELEERVTEKVPYRTPTGEIAYKEVIREIKKKASSPEDLVRVVGVQLSRFVREGVISRVKTERPEVSRVGPPRERGGE